MEEQQNNSNQENKKERNNTLITTIFFVIAVLLFFALGFVYSDRMQEKQELKQQQIQKELELNQTLLTQGAQAGYQKALADVFQIAAKCKQIPLTVEDKKLNLIAVECLQK